MALYQLDGYIGSVSAFGNGRYAASSPRGGLALQFDAAALQVGTYRAQDVCGLCAAPDGSCLVTDGTGQVHTLTGDTLTHRTTHPLAFDNHLTAI